MGETMKGTPQGAVISPILANIYLHYVLDLWVKCWRQTRARGETYIVRYADDFVMGFQYHNDATKLLVHLHDRLAKFGLELHPEKTRLIQFGRFAAEDRQKRGLPKPETFDFLGFTHFCSKTRRDGRFTVGRRTIAKRLRAKAKKVRDILMRMRHRTVKETGQWLRSVSGVLPVPRSPGKHLRNGRVPDASHPSLEGGARKTQPTGRANALMEARDEAHHHVATKAGNPPPLPE